MVLRDLRDALALRCRAWRAAPAMPALLAELAELRAFREAVDEGLAQHDILVLAADDNRLAQEGASMVVAAFEAWAYGRTEGVLGPVPTSSDS